MKLLIAFSALAGFAVSQNVECVKPMDDFNYVAAKYPVGAKIDLKSIQAKIDKINADILNNNPSIGKGDIIDKKALAEKYGDKLKATLEKIQEQKKIKLQKKDQKNGVKVRSAEDEKAAQKAAKKAAEKDARKAARKAAKKAQKELDKKLDKAAEKAEKKLENQLAKKAKKEEEQKEIELQKKEFQANFEDKWNAALNGQLPQAAFVPGQLYAKEVDSLDIQPPQIQPRNAED